MTPTRCCASALLALAAAAHAGDGTTSTTVEQSLAGTVFDASTELPIAHAEIRYGPHCGWESGDSPPVRSTTTDNEGRYRLGDLPHWNFCVEAHWRALGRQAIDPRAGTCRHRLTPSAAASVTVCLASRLQS